MQVRASSSLEFMRMQRGWWVTDDKWCHRFMEMAQLVAGWSKDPSGGVGAVVADRLRRVVGTGYNGLPMGVEDSERRLTDRGYKYPMTVHAEVNALLVAGPAAREGVLFTTMGICCDCAGLVIQAGVSAVVQPRLDDTEKDRADRWRASHEMGLQMLREAGVEVFWL